MDNVPDDVLHWSQFDDETPPPIPPKRFEEDPEESQYEDVIKYAYLILYMQPFIIQQYVP